MNAALLVLPTLILLPAVTALLVPLAGERSRTLAIAAASTQFGLTLAALLAFDADQPGPQLVTRARWLPALGVEWHVAIDGLSAAFLPLVPLVTLVALLGVRPLRRGALSALLLLSTAGAGVVCAQDLGLFFLFWEALLPPAFWLVARDGDGPFRTAAATKYLLTLLLASAPFIVALGWLHRLGAESGMPAPLDLVAWKAAGVPMDAQVGLFLLLLLPFAAKAPLVPFHTWLPAVLDQGPAAAAIPVLSLKFGVFAFLRVSFAILPHGVEVVGPWLLGWALASAAFAALVALATRDLRRFVAFFAISHASLAVAAVATGTAEGAVGAVAALVAMALSTSGIVLVTDALRARTGSLRREALGGVVHAAPWLAWSFLAFALAGIGFPGTFGFAGELMAVTGAFLRAPFVGVVFLVIAAIGAAAAFSAFSEVMQGPATRAPVRLASDLLPHERGVAVVLVSLTLIFGFIPGPALELSRTSVSTLAGAAPGSPEAAE